MYKIILSVIGASVMLPATAFAGCGADQPCLSWTEAPRAQSSHYAPQSFYAATAPRAVQLAGLSPDESLCPATCPVDVEVPKGGKVLDCYKICKTVQTATRPEYRLIRVVRPIVYVQRPAVYHKPHDCRKACKTSRYGY